MLKSRLASIVNICTRHAWSVIAVAVLLTVITGAYSVQNFAINTDVNKLISPDLPWRQRELAVDAAFPHRNETILAVVEAGTSERATQATEALLPKLKDQKDLFKAVEQLGGGELLLPQRATVPVDRGRRKNRRAVRSGAASDSGAGGRSMLARIGAGPLLHLGGSAAEHVHARPDGGAAGLGRHHD